MNITRRIALSWLPMLASVFSVAAVAEARPRPVAKPVSKPAFAARWEACRTKLRAAFDVHHCGTAFAFADDYYGEDSRFGYVFRDELGTKRVFVFTQDEIESQSVVQLRERTFAAHRVRDPHNVIWLAEGSSTRPARLISWPDANAAHRVRHRYFR